LKSPILSINENLVEISRVPSLASGAGQMRVVELTVLVLAGAVAALLTNLLRLRLGIPGSSIVFAVLPMAFGFAVVPRRGAGTVMAGGAFLTTAILRLVGARLDGVGALTSLLLTGPMLDLALRWAHRGWQLYGGFIVACAVSNAVAFLVRGAAKVVGGGGGLPLDLWWSRAIMTHAASGVVAGLISALAWFQFHARKGVVERRTAP
jgi:hypothetical protein